ncbi:MAG TPA: glycoside hydrolase family 15 protein, partial [Polyangiaceae bacterium]
ISASSRVWFSTAGGVLTEVFYPTPDQACIRRLGFLVTDSRGFVSDEATDATHTAEAPDADNPVSTMVSTCVEGRYRIEKGTLADPRADVLLQHVRLVATRGDPSDYRLFCIFEPHLGDRGDAMTAEIGEHKGCPMLFATSSDGLAVALACSAPWLAASAGFAGTSDGRRELLRTGGTLERCYRRAGPGHVALTAEVPHEAMGGEATLALGFARTREEAAHLALASLHRGFEAARAQLTSEWKGWSDALLGCHAHDGGPRLWARSVAVLKTMESNAAAGGRVAALATPWGASKGPGIDGTYHLVWTRDLVESVSALLAAGAHDEARRALLYLRCTQEPDGHWPQNMRMDGRPFWTEQEVDETALPLVLLHLVRRENLLDDRELRALWPMVRNAAAYVARTGPSTKRDRWEDTEGVTPFTLAASISALVVAAELAEHCGEPDAAPAYREVADAWNAGIDGWLYRRGGQLAAKVGVPGYYVRARKPGRPFAPDLDLARLPTTEVSPDVLALVRFGLRSPDDPRIVNTLRVVDAVLGVDLPAGPAWRRYPCDEYGEYEDGAPFDGHGVGRPWPLFTGERAHYELACGRPARARALLQTMESFASATGYLPEQVWDGRDIPERGLRRGGPSGSACPLGWAHAEYVKLCRSLKDGRVFDQVQLVRRRYSVDK